MKLNYEAPSLELFEVQTNAFCEEEETVSDLSGGSLSVDADNGSGLGGSGGGFGYEVSDGDW